MKKRIKLLYDPYKNKVSFSLSQDSGESWQDLDESSDLRNYENTEFVFSNCADDIVDSINKYHNVGSEGVQIDFIGTVDDFEVLCNAVEITNAKGKKKGYISCEHCGKFLSADDAISIIREGYNRISAEFFDYLPGSENYLSSGEVSKTIGDKISSFNSTVSTEIPVCIIGTYSVGKSAIINAIVGSEILPSELEPCTAKNVKVQNSEIYALTLEYCGKQIRFIAQNGIVLPEVENEASTEIAEILNHLLSQKDADGATVIRSILNVLNASSDESDWQENIGNNIVIEVPFCKSILNNSTAKIVLIDTPGSDNSNVNQQAHRVSLEDLMQHQTNALPVFIMDREKIEGNDNNDVKELIDSNKSGFSSPNCLVVFSKAERLGVSNLKKTIPTSFLNWHGRITYLYVCAVGALGAKKDKPEFVDADYADAYKKWKRCYADDELSLPQYNSIPCGREIAPTIKGSINDELFASGIPSLEDEINYYVEKYANYKKCVNGQKLLLESMELASEKLQNKEELLAADKKKKIAEQTKKREELLKALRAISPSSVNIKFLESEYADRLEAYCKTVPRAVQDAWRYSQSSSDKKKAMAEYMQRHCMENLFVPAYEGEDGISRQIISILISCGNSYVTTLRGIVDEEKTNLSEEAANELDVLFQQLSTPEFGKVDIKFTSMLLEVSSALNWKVLQEKELNRIAEKFCTKLRRHNEGILFLQHQELGAFVEYCIQAPVKAYYKQLKQWAEETRKDIESTLTRDNAILSQYDAEIQETEDEIRILTDRLSNLGEVKKQLETVMTVQKGEEYGDDE